MSRFRFDHNTQIQNFDRQELVAFILTKRLAQRTQVETIIL